jgi:hypothetical protein
MPQRQNTRRFLSSAVQGDDSYVVVTRLTVGEAKNIHKMQVARGEDNPDIDSLEAVIPLYIQHIADWNWVDDDGKPLPLPKQDPGVIDQLTDQEFAYLGDILADEVEASGEESGN